MLRIVHISDIHLSQSVIPDIEDFLIKALIDDLLKFNNEKKIDLILISGDILDKGAESFQNDIMLGLLTFEDKILSAIIANLKIDQDRVFFVPGNHDILKTADGDIEEFGLRSLLSTTERLNEHIDKGIIKGIERIIPFKEFEKIYYSKCNFIDHDITNYQSCFKMDIDGLLVGVTCFNTAWRCFDSKSDKGNILLGEKQVISSRKVISNCDIKIAVIHHPLDWLATFDYDSVNNLIQRDYNLLFCGHAHKGSSWAKTNMYGTLFVSIAPGNWAYNLRSTDRIYHSGFSVIDYDLSNYQIVSHHRRYNHQKECFDPNTDLGDSQGKFIYPIPDSQMLANYNQENNISTFILANHYDEINEHLLSYNTDTKAPKILNDLFVMPRIVSRIEYDPGNISKEDVHNLHDICEMNGHLVIFGIKESGKTIFLDKVMLELITNINNSHKLPIYVDFDELGNKRFETVISNYSGVSITDIPKLLSNRNIVLLIDNIMFEQSNFHKLNRLRKLIEEYDKIQIIATSPIVIEGKIPMEFLDHSLFSSFSYVFIRAFKVREIRELINKWFSNNELFDTPNKLDKILKTLLSLNLPRTPLAISMFLWIIEHQENYRPINHATMLENFIERLFKKQSKKEIYSDEFDYRNKERLLTEISFNMYNNNMDNYSIPYADMLKFIESYLIKRSFHFDPIHILDYFIDKGIFVKDSYGIETFLRFRFGCFFEYFLMKKMEYDNSFCEYVLDEKNYLNFINEIDYLTGIKRDKAEILKELVRRMNIAYNDIRQEIMRSGITFDDFFETQKPLACNLDNTFVKKLSESSKPNEHQLDEIRDNMLETIKSDNGVQKKRELKPIQKLEFMVVLAARVLKNTEETEIKDLKFNSYKDIINCSIIFSIIYKYLILDYISKNEEKLVKAKDEILIIKNVVPLLTEIVLFEEMGSSKLSLVIKEKIEDDLIDSNITDFEKFISVFLYCDLKGKDYKKFIGKFIKSIKKAYIMDMSLMKLITYYFLRSKSKLSDKFYQAAIADLIIQAKGYNKSRKLELMEYYSEKKRAELKVKEENCT